MHQSVAHNEVFDFQHEVVTRDLVKHGLGDFDVRGFVFHNQFRTQIAIVKHRVAAFAGAVQLQLHLVGQQPFGVSFVSEEEMDEMLPHPFLRGEGDVPFAKPVENDLSSVTLREFYFVRREV